MSLDNQKLVTTSGREYPDNYKSLYYGNLGYFQSLKVLLKLIVWDGLLKPGVLWRVWIVRILLPFMWLFLWAAAKGSLLPFAVAGIPCLFLSVYIFEQKTGLKGFLMLSFGISIPLVIAVSPILAYFFKGANDGLGKSNIWNDFCSFNTIKQSTSGRTQRNH